MAPLGETLRSTMNRLRSEAPEILRALRITGAAFPAEADYTTTLALGEQAATLLPVGFD